MLDWAWLQWLVAIISADVVLRGCQIGVAWLTSGHQQGGQPVFDELATWISNQAYGW
jgi:hypothetical protein